MIECFLTCAVGAKPDGNDVQRGLRARLVRVRVPLLRNDHLSRARPHVQRARRAGHRPVPRRHQRRVRGGVQETGGGPDGRCVRAARARPLRQPGALRTDLRAHVRHLRARDWPQRRRSLLRAIYCCPEARAAIPIRTGTTQTNKHKYNIVL